MARYSDHCVYRDLTLTMAFDTTNQVINVKLLRGTSD